jgi:putative flippase GtrA
MSTSISRYLRKLTSFGLVGVIGTAAHYVTLVFLVEVIGVAPVGATSVGFAVGALVNYVLNYRFTFQSSKPHLTAGSKFFLIALATGLLNAFLVRTGVDVLGFNYLLVQVVATLFVFLANFLLNNIWTFKESDAI